MTFPKTPFSLR